MILTLNPLAACRHSKRYGARSPLARKLNFIVRRYRQGVFALLARLVRTNMQNRVSPRPKEIFRRDHVFVTLDNMLSVQPGPYREHASSFAVTRDIIRRFFGNDLDQLQVHMTPDEAADEMNTLMQRPASSNYEFPSRSTSAASHARPRTSNAGYTWTEKDFHGCYVRPDMADTSPSARQQQGTSGRTEDPEQMTFPFQVTTSAIAERL